MAEIKQGRWTAQIEGDFVVFIIGTRADLRHPVRWFRDVGGLRGMPAMLKELSQDPESGLLGGRRATTHWRYVEELAARYPAISVDRDVLYVQDGTIITGAGSAAGLDAALHVMRQQFGSQVAAAAARRMVIPAHRDGGQAQFIERAVTDCEAEVWPNCAV